MRASSSLGTERLGDVVVGAHLQADDPVRLLRHGGQQDDRDPRRLAQVPAQRETVLAGHHDVEDHEVDRRRLQCPSGGGAPVDHRDTHVVPFQVSPQRFANLPVVVDHQHVR